LPAEALLSGKLLQGFQLDFLIRNGALQERNLVSMMLYFNCKSRCRLGGKQILGGCAVGLCSHRRLEQVQA
jgi:hypothetical protein